MAIEVQYEKGSCRVCSKEAVCSVGAYMSILRDTRSLRSCLNDNIMPGVL